MRIWIDLATGPQVLFMRPIIKELQKRGNDVMITTRDFTETISLADKYKLSHTIIGAHGGAKMIAKGYAIVHRAAMLVQHVSHYHAELALGGSYSQSLATPVLRIPLVVCGDYEGNPANHVICRVARRILVPNVFHKPNLLKYGASLSKIVSYSGLKENVYLADFSPHPKFLEDIGISQEKIIVTMRPPSDVSAYHRFKNPLFDELLVWIANQANTQVVLLPRGQEQRQTFASMKMQNVLIPEKVLDGPNLVYYSDLVVGAGGTMNREATVLGTPVYTIFKGELGSVDKHLIGVGKMVRIENITDTALIKLSKKNQSAHDWKAQGEGLAIEIVDKILEVYF